MLERLRNMLGVNHNFVRSNMKTTVITRHANLSPFTKTLSKIRVHQTSWATTFTAIISPIYNFTGHFSLCSACDARFAGIRPRQCGRVKSGNEYTRGSLNRSRKCIAFVARARTIRANDNEFVSGHNSY